jgi:class 3 adenylate cyclase
MSKESAKDSPKESPPKTAAASLLARRPQLALVFTSAALGILGGLLGGWVWDAKISSDALEAAGQAATFSWTPSLDGFGVGWVLFSAVSFALGRLLLGVSSVHLYRQIRDKADEAGLQLPEAKLNMLRPLQAERALEDLTGRAGYFVMQARKEKDKYQEALAKYADPTLSARLKENTGAAGVGTRKLNCAILFCDIRGFTAMSEKLKVEEVVHVLNSYFTVGSQIIATCDGQINKFIGDAILAVFQDPPGFSTGSTACRNAVRAGMDLVAAFRRERVVWAEKIPTPFDVDLGVGIHFGELIMGNFGSPQRIEYTVIGDTVNFASRLCSLAQRGQVRASEEVYKIVESYYSADKMEPVKVKGKTGEYSTYLLTGKKAGAL